MLRFLGVARLVLPALVTLLLACFHMNVPKLTAREKQLAEQYARYALMFAAPIFFGLPPELGGMAAGLNNGTVTLLELNGRRFGITASHVIEGFRQRSAEDKQVVCQIGRFNVEPLARLISENKKHDLAVLDLNNIDPRQLGGVGPIKHAFHAPREWPPQPPEADKFVIFGGYPGSRREQHDQDGVMFGTVSSGGSRVNSVQEDVFTFQTEIGQCFISFDLDGRGFTDLPGMSGAPVMIRRQTDEGIDVFDMVGIYFEYHEEWDIHRARPTSLIGADGIIKEG